MAAYKDVIMKQMFRLFASKEPESEATIVDSEGEDKNDDDDDGATKKGGRHRGRIFDQNRKIYTDERTNRGRYHDARGQQEKLNYTSSSDSDQSSSYSDISPNSHPNQRQASRYRKRSPDNDVDDIQISPGNRNIRSVDNSQDRGVNRQKNYKKDQFYSDDDSQFRGRFRGGRKSSSDDDSHGRGRAPQRSIYSSSDDSLDQDDDSLVRDKAPQNRKNSSDDASIDHGRSPQNRKYPSRYCGKLSQNIKHSSDYYSPNRAKFDISRKYSSSDNSTDRGRTPRKTKYSSDYDSPGSAKFHQSRKYSAADHSPDRDRNPRKNKYTSDYISPDRGRSARNKNHSSDEDSYDRKRTIRKNNKNSDNYHPDQRKHRGEEAGRRKLKYKHSTYSDNEDSFSSDSPCYEYKERVNPKKEVHERREDRKKSKNFTKRSSDSNGNVKTPEICYYSVEGICRYEKSGCRRLHADQHYHWQVSLDEDDWINLSLQLSDALEQLYCQPGNEYGNLPAPDSRSKDELIGIIGLKQLKVDFIDMILTSPTRKPLHLRRLCSELIYDEQVPSSTFVWYFKDAKNIWTPYGSMDYVGVKHYTSTINSNNIETKFLQGKRRMKFSNSKFSYKIYFKQMIQINQETQTERDVCRRPLFTLSRKSGLTIPNKKFSETSSKNENSSKAIWTHNLHGTVKVPEICYYSVESGCKREDSGCKRLHSTKHFHWQVTVDGTKWYNLLKSQSKVIEKDFGDVDNQNMQLKALIPSDLASFNRELQNVLGNSTFSIDFKAMTLTVSTSKVLELRRLCSELIPGNSLKENTFIWYFKDKNNKWIAYGDSDSAGITDLATNATSKDIEKEYINNSKTMTIKNAKFTLLINFVSMKQINQETKTQRDIQRRPKQSDSNKNMSLMHWAPMPNNNKTGFLRVALDTSSSEYKKVIGIIKGKLSNITKIERIQNKFLWKAFENKVNEMTMIYGGNVASVNIQHLFHGTKISVIDAICAENFDPKCHGAALGDPWYGRGVYFSPLADWASKFSGHADPSSVNRYTFVAKVAIGTTVKGGKGMARPPINPTTGRPYDSTVDNVSDVKEIVKYDKQEFYPEFLIYYS